MVLRPVAPQAPTQATAVVFRGLEPQPYPTFWAARVQLRGTAELRRAARVQLRDKAALRRAAPQRVAPQRVRFHPP